MRTAAVIVGVICVATVLSELVGLGFLWYRGQLTPATIADMQLALSGEDDSVLDVEDGEKQDQPSNEEYAEERITRILGLSTRQEELNLLKRVITDNRKGLIEKNEEFREQKAEFEKQLQELQTASTSTAMEQTRGILVSLPPADAVDNLMGLTTEANVQLLKGMPEKTIAKILQEFLSGDESEKTRGQDVFRAISEGEPTKKLIDEAFTGLAGERPAAN